MCIRDRYHPEKHNFRLFKRNDMYKNAGFKSVYWGDRRSSQRCGNCWILCLNLFRSVSLSTINDMVPILCTACELADTHWSDIDVCLELVLLLIVELRRHSKRELSNPLSSLCRGPLRWTSLQQGIRRRIWNSLLNFSCKKKVKFISLLKDRIYNYTPLSRRVIQ